MPKLTFDGQNEIDIYIREKTILCKYRDIGTIQDINEKLLRLEAYEKIADTPESLEKVFAEYENKLIEFETLIDELNGLGGMTYIKNLVNEASNIKMSSPDITDLQIATESYSQKHNKTDDSINYEVKSFERKINMEFLGNLKGKKIIDFVLNFEYKNNHYSDRIYFEKDLSLDILHTPNTFNGKCQRFILNLPSGILFNS